MSKKIYVCTGKSCKKTKTDKLIKQWGKELIATGKLKKLKKSKCLGICKKNYAIEYKGTVHSCNSREELELVITKKKKRK